MILADDFNSKILKHALMADRGEPVPPYLQPAKPRSFFEEMIEACSDDIYRRVYQLPSRH
jgi:hypothetical protein